MNVDGGVVVEGVDVYAPDKPTHAFAGIYATARAHRAHAHKHTKTYTNTTHTYTHLAYAHESSTLIFQKLRSLNS